MGKKESDDELQERLRNMAINECCHMVRLTYQKYTELQTSDEMPKLGCSHNLAFAFYLMYLFNVSINCLEGVEMFSESSTGLTQGNFQKTY